ncbi:hypothetical protein LK08_22775 [Streptomyces sp. MUSC 125]|uniref:hypothetical protein n=1 Tax=unclassified Streptomyces TaxID=2593676 RepID=UPI00057D952B|nr:MULTISPECIES: hypothetical protein [unclassified Streptomyces]KIE24716.1 hypothetical protein LK08_22775 [Streptomyces sp. MUSC 125]MCH0560405.1 hypothetical protein [Streptomyces sp. MUM 16J]
MIERIYRKLVSLAPAPPDSNIPLPVPFQTATLTSLLVEFRFSSLLSAVTVSVVALGTSHQVLLSVAPVVLADRSVVSYRRMRRA